MSLVHGPSPVTSGLVMCVDAANTKSYPGSGTAWNDPIANRYNFTLTNSPTFSSSNGGYFTFNGSTTYAVSGYNTALDTQTPTVEVWVKTNATTQNGFWFEKGAVNTQYALFQEGANITWRQTTNIGSLVTPAANWMSTSAWAQVVGTFTSGDRRIYVNGVQVANDTQAYTIPTNSSGMSIGAYGGNSGSLGYYYNGAIAIVRVYNRALSASEVLQNFNANRSRFGL